MIEVINAYTREIEETFATKEEAEQWIGTCAEKWNYGIYRFWTMSGYDYYDVGPRVFCIKQD